MMLLPALNAWAQKKHPLEKSVSLTAAFGSREVSTSLVGQFLYKAGKKQRLGIGAGVKLTNYFANNQYYTTAPAKLTSGKTGPAVFFAEDIVENIDTVILNKAQVNALNLSLNFTYDIYKKITLGFAIDAIGFSFGRKQSGPYLSNSGAGTVTTAKPTGFNLLLISDNDKGSLNSEFYAACKLNNKWSAKVGFQFLFTEYTTPAKIQITPDGQTNDRFRNKSSGISLGVIHKF